MKNKIASLIGFLLVIAVFVAVPIANQGNKSKITIEKEVGLLQTVKNEVTLSVESMLVCLGLLQKMKKETGVV